MANLFKVVFLGLVGFGLLVYLTAEKPKQIKKISELGYDIIMWNVLAIDWDKSVTKEKCLKNVIDNTNSGSIVVFHDSIKASKVLHVGDINSLLNEIRK